MKFAIAKCATLSVKQGKTVESQGIELPDGEIMKGLKEGESYKYLGILQADQVKHTEMKEKISGEYFRRVKKCLETKLNGGNII